MKSECLPFVLSISLSTWRDDGNTHTQTDLFKYWQSDRLAQVYARSSLPQTSVCNKFFQISENAVIKSVFSRQGVGRDVANEDAPVGEDADAIAQEQKLYAVGHKRKSWLLTLAREVVWSLGKWRTEALDSFVESCRPDIYFVPIYPVVYMGKIQLHILKKSPRPYVCYLADDNYSYDNCGHNPLAYLHRWWLRRYVRQLAENCTEMFAITERQARETDELFGTHSVVLTKGIDYEGLVYRFVAPSEPLRMVYTGNLLIGRDSSLVAISKAMMAINEREERVRLDIYSPTELPASTMEQLNSNGCHHHGNVSREEVVEIQASSDIVVFAESLEETHRQAARLSFSTKLTDYFRSGKCIFAIGDASIAPIEYLVGNDAAVVCTCYEDIEKNLRMLIDNPRLLDKYGRNAFECGKRNHNEADVRETFVSTLKRAAGSRGSAGS